MGGPQGWQNFQSQNCSHLRRLAGSVGRARDSQSQGREFKPHVGHSAYLKKQTKKTTTNLQPSLTFTLCQAPFSPLATLCLTSLPQTHEGKGIVTAMLADAQRDQGTCLGSLSS